MEVRSTTPHSAGDTVPMTPKQAARILLRSRQALLVASFAFSGLWAWRYEGLFRVIADLEVRWGKGYDWFFTLMFTFLTLFVVLLALEQRSLRLFVLAGLLVLGAILRRVLRRSGPRYAKAWM